MIQLYKSLSILLGLTKRLLHSVENVAVLKGWVQALYKLVTFASFNVV